MQRQSYNMIENDKSLKGYNTFGFNQKAERFVSVTSEEALQEMVAYARKNNWPTMILGGGSNIVLIDDIPGLVIHLKNDDIVDKSSNKKGEKIIKASAGVNWHELVRTTLSMGAQGLENLSLIPGNVGAAPVQNIGAYGVEVKDRINAVRALHMPSMTWHNFSAEDCNFSYRHSYFKDTPNEYAITQVEFNLGSQCELRTGYESLKNQLEILGITEPTPLQISDVVSSIRQSRLPDPALLGNAGSFFHNPIVTESKALELIEKFPELVSYPATKGFRKLSAAWMIDHAGFKGTIKGKVGVYDNQALVLVNLGGGTGKSILLLADEIKESIKEIYSVSLSIEPLLLP